MTDAIGNFINGIRICCVIYTGEGLFLNLFDFTYLFPDAQGQ